MSQRPTLRKSGLPRVSADHRRAPEVALRQYLAGLATRSGLNLRDPAWAEPVRELSECTLELLHFAEMIRTAREQREPRAKLLALYRNRRKSRVQRTMLERHLRELAGPPAPRSVGDLLAAHERNGR